MTDHIADTGKKVIDLDALEKLADEATLPMSVKTMRMHKKAVREFRIFANPATIKALIAELREARAILEPFALLAVDEENGIKGINMNDPISKWLTIAQLVDARAFLARNGKGEG